ncbi:unnamed protein product [Albugo candida]|uniref:Iron-binding zinc finger CDGSH type domain-containing protein n=1 Tax=Albugo candida TaxID=65357 RepID=A0A024GE78_9STRA|nr:unnamed protein product [Albugo candida]|eukprot:CCI44825.1 unnamed protein product [Albugo candida]
MDVIRQYVKVQLPRYLRNLPLPRTFSGFLKLKQDEWMYLAPFLITVGLILYSFFCPSGGKTPTKRKTPPPRINGSIKLSSAKVVDTLKITDVEDLCAKGDGKCVMCRCWKSKTFPYCDGSHTKHNKATGDNVGPLIIQSGKK